MREYLSSHCDISVTGSLAGPVMSSSIVTSDISMNSRSRIFLTTFIGRDAAGLKGPWGMTVEWVAGGLLPLVTWASVDAAAAASNSSPGTAAGSGLNRGSCLAGRLPKAGPVEGREGTAITFDWPGGEGPRCCGSSQAWLNW